MGGTGFFFRGPGEWVSENRYCKVRMVAVHTVTVRIRTVLTRKQGTVRIDEFPNSCPGAILRV